MLRSIVVICALGAACATQKPNQVKVVSGDAPYSSAGQAKPKGVMRCHLERDTGSNYAERVCTYDEPGNDKGDDGVDDAIRRAQQRGSQRQPAGP